MLETYAPRHQVVHDEVEAVGPSSALGRLLGWLAEPGGQVYVPPTDIGVGRFAVLADAQGAAFTVFKANTA